jgi:hypothetical protein
VLRQGTLSNLNKDGSRAWGECREDAVGLFGGGWSWEGAMREG